MPTKPNRSGEQQNYVPAGNGDASGEYGNSESGSNKHFTNFKKENTSGNEQTYYKHDKVDGIWHDTGESGSNGGRVFEDENGSKWEVSDDFFKKGGFSEVDEPQHNFKLNKEQYPDVEETKYGFIYNVGKNGSITDLRRQNKAFGKEVDPYKDYGFSYTDGNGDEKIVETFYEAYKGLKGIKKEAEFKDAVSRLNKEFGLSDEKGFHLAKTNDPAFDGVNILHPSGIGMTPNELEYTLKNGTLKGYKELADKRERAMRNSQFSSFNKPSANEKELKKAKQKVDRYGLNTNRDKEMVGQVETLLKQFDSDNDKKGALKELKNKISQWQRSNLLDTNVLRDVRLDYFLKIQKHMEENM